MRERLPTISGVASRAGVSSATVSRVINRSGFVSAAARVAVLEAIDDLGYVPSAAARGLASRQAGMIGICLPDVGPGADLVEREVSDGAVLVQVDPEPDGAIAWGGIYFGEVLRGAEYAAWEAGLAITVAMTREPDLEARVLNMAGRVDGLVVVGETLSDDLLDHVARRVPIVVLAGPRAADRHDQVMVGNADGMERLVDHLIDDHGIETLAYVAGRSGAPDDDERFRGFCAALSRHGIEVPQSPRHRGDFSRHRAREIGRSLVEAARQGEALPRALVCCNDETALGLLDVLVAHGIRVPEDIVLTGFDGIDAARTSAPPITTVEQPMAELGRLAVERLTARIASPRRRPTVTQVPVTVMLRGSCGPHALTPLPPGGAVVRPHHE
ncbi:LacI family transcriptional regulator [Sanguibacter gelidistatuariae]|uniref:LacI family transcriptional regulator n=1 Tax=Sanguibacter gelidistatuariae TaxID=1814289 RepID=A0A1G6XG63_9MICO|nr:LacI family DNA-binding transcriptional regulator [Sanguibacter gelidistatuariae]SDD77209.1 LacI family transcriptional regulator [Sanguibacter gelidistatuariae]